MTSIYTHNFIIQYYNYNIGIGTILYDGNVLNVSSVPDQGRRTPSMRSKLYMFIRKYDILKTNDLYLFIFK